MGGLSKKAFQLEKMQREDPAPALVIDSGNLLFKDEHLEGLARQQAEITAAGIVQAYNLMGYDAVGVGRNDLAGGLDFLKKIQAQSEFPWLSANLVSTITGKTIFQDSIIKKSGGLNVGLIALTGASHPLPDDVAILPWQEVLPPLVEKISQTADLIVLLSNNPISVNREIARSVMEVHLIIQADPQSANMAPELLHNTLICQTGKQGKYMGKLVLNWKKSKSWGTDDLGNRLKLKHRELEGITARLNRYNNKLSQEELKNSKAYQSLINERDRVSQQEDTIFAEIKQQQADSTAPSTYANSFTALEVSMPDQPQVLEIMEQIKKNVNTAALPQPSAVAQKTLLTPTDPPQRMAGWQACTPCHDPEVRAWEKTSHARSYLTLVENGQDKNLKCLPCHVTVAGQDGLPPAMALLNLPADLQSVSCEVCHGNGRKHADDPTKEGMEKTPGQEVCLDCHTPDRDDNFEYAVKLKKIGHAKR